MLQRQQNVVAGDDETLAVDHCVPTGKCFLLQNKPDKRRAFTMTTSRNKVKGTWVVENNSWREVESAMKAEDESKTISATAICVDDVGARPSWHADGRKFMEVLSTVQHVTQDAGHWCDRLLQTQCKVAKHYGESARRLGGMVKFIPQAQVNKWQNLLTTPAHTDGGYASKAARSSGSCAP